MRRVTAKMIKSFEIKKLGFDFMGYLFSRPKDLSFHHLIVPACLSGGAIIRNGAVLNGKTSHEYLHRIERVDIEIFFAITSEMIDENIQRKLQIENLKRIRDLLLYFEKEHCTDKCKNGSPLIKESYIIKRKKF